MENYPINPEEPLYCIHCALRDGRLEDAHCMIHDGGFGRYVPTCCACCLEYYQEPEEMAFPIQICLN